jgi:hypothetical protein
MDFYKAWLFGYQVFLLIEAELQSKLKSNYAKEELILSTLLII